LLPAGGMLISIFVGWKLDRQFIKEELSNHGVSRVWYFGILMFCMRFVAPVAIFLIFLSGLGLF
jgi:NSS family neurotransmitter:Na+ symporter